MVARGCLMLLHVESIEDPDLTLVSVKLCSFFLSVIESFNIDREKPLTEQHDFVKFMVSCPTAQLHDMVIRQQGIISGNIVTGQPKIEVIKASIQILDLIKWINTFKEDPIELKEFSNF